MTPTVENAENCRTRTSHGMLAGLGGLAGARAGALDGVELVGAGEIARVGVGVLVRHLDGAEHELPARLAVDGDLVGVGAGRVARDDAPRALQNAVLD